jgi:orotate phosphoribosyltransferase
MSSETKPLTADEITELFAKAKAILTNGHFVYTSSKHGSEYVNKDAVYPHVGIISRLCQEIALRFSGYGVQVVAAPATGGIVLTQWVAYWLEEMTGQPVLAVYAEKREDNKGFEFRRGYASAISGKKVLVVEDVVNTGGSVKDVVEAVVLAGGMVEAVAALCNRGGVKAEDIGAQELNCLMNVSMQAQEEEDCELCRAGVEINTEVGKGLEFKKKQKSLL